MIFERQTAFGHPKCFFKQKLFGYCIKIGVSRIDPVTDPPFEKLALKSGDHSKKREK